MSKTVKGLLEHCKLSKEWMYVYGKKGSILTLQEYNSLKGMYGSLVWDSDKSKIGKVCCDCSGLISSYTGIVRNSKGYADTALKSATISQLKANWKAYVGWGIWLNGHIGVVSDTEGYYYAMDGSARNWVHNQLSMNNWVKVIKLKDIDYSECKESVSNTAVNKENNTEVVNVYYRAYAGKWYSEVVNCNDTSSEGYAGVNKKAVSALMAKLSKGNISTRVHLKKDGRWLPWVNGYNVNDNNNGYAGIIGQAVDGIQFKISDLTGYKVMYRVSTVDSDTYLPWVEGTSDYAGIFGKEIDKIQIKIVK